MGKQIIAFSGRKQSGKDGVCKHLMDNRIYLWRQRNVQIFALVEPLKTLCIDMLGLLPEQVYGTDEQKNSLTRYRWEDLPHYQKLVTVILERIIKELDAKNIGGRQSPQYKDEYIWIHNRDIPQGVMTGRQVMQEMGAALVGMSRDIFVNAVLHKIECQDVEIALISDVRLPHEVAAIQATGGRVIRLARVADPNDKHITERALDACVYDWSNFDAVIDNGNMTVAEQNAAVVQMVSNWGLNFTDAESHCQD